jgi:hypothetical protein
MTKLPKQSSLKELAKVANDCHARAESDAHTAIKFAKSATEWARKSGEALRVARKRIGHGGWEEWRDANFKGAARSASDYMRVAKTWNDDRVIAYRREATAPSIAGLLEVLRNESIKLPEKKTLDDVGEQLLGELEMVRPGLSTKGGEQSNYFIFKNGKVMTYNGSVACISECCLDIEGDGVAS